MSAGALLYWSNNTEIHGLLGGRYQFENHCCVFKSSNAQDFQKAYSELEVKHTEIQNHLRYLVDAPLVSISYGALQRTLEKKV